jgi:hypothetical protein
MKKSILVLFLTFCQFSFSQEYRFDSYYFYNSKDGDRFFMINSNDDSFFLWGYGTSDLMYGNIIDFKKKEIHHLSVTNVETDLEFNYEYSLKGISGPVEKSNIIFDSSKVDIDSLQTSYIYKKFKVSSRGKRKYLGEIEVQYDNSDFVFHAITLKIFSHHFFNVNEIKNLGNKLPIKFNINNNDGKVINFNLTKKQKINALLTISNEQINFK